MATTNFNRIYKSITPTLLTGLGNAGANLTAINAALASVKGTDVGVYIPSGTWFFNAEIIVDSATLFGEADSILTGNDGTTTPSCNIRLKGVRPHLLWLTSTTQGATVRGTQIYNCGATFDSGTTGGVMKQVTVNAPASAGFFSFGAKNSRLEYCVDNNSLADAFHHTFGTTNAECSHCTAAGVGDDYFAVVSYNGETISSNILFHDFVGTGQLLNGRGATVVGGNNITFRNGSLSHCQVRGIYITSEVSFDSLGVNGVILDTISINGTGLQAGFNADPGAAAVWVNGRTAFSVSNVSTNAINVISSSGPHTVNGGTNVSNISFSGVN